MTTEEKAAKMQNWTLLATVRRFLEQLGPWPQTKDEWATAYDLWMESRKGFISSPPRT